MVKTFGNMIMFYPSLCYNEGIIKGLSPCENEVGFIGTVLELSGTHFNGTFWDNHLIPINPNIGIIWY